VKSPPANANARRATGRREELNSEPHYRLAGVSQATLTIWREEAARLLSEHRRTDNNAHLKAFRVHRTAVGGRLHGKEAVR
jgi:hypothetical protein